MINTDIGVGFCSFSSDNANKKEKETESKNQNLTLISLLLITIALAGFILSLLAFWPGFMEYDSFNQYKQAIGTLPLEDWHPPSMTLFWRVLIGIYSGPQPMLLLQCLLYWLGTTE